MLDVVAFISEVEKHPELWDVNCEDFRFKHRKQRAWAQIARVLVKDFDDQQMTEKNEICKKLSIKWKSIRDTFVRDVRKNCNQPRYIYKDNLAFLNVSYKVYQSESEDTENQGEVMTKKMKTSGHDDDSLDDSNMTDERGFPQPKMHFMDFPDQTSHFQIEDDDKSFFDSLLPAVREFNLDQKLELRSEILNLIKNIRSRNVCIKIEPCS